MMKKTPFLNKFLLFRQKKEEEKKISASRFAQKNWFDVTSAFREVTHPPEKVRKKILQLLFVGSGVSQFLFNLFRMVPV